MANISHFTQTVNGISTTYDIHDANAVDLTSNQTVAGNKEFTGTTTAHDVIPSATDTYNFGSSSAQWNNAYIKALTVNGTAAGDILTHNAAEFVPVSGGEVMTGNLLTSSTTGFIAFGCGWDRGGTIYAFGSAYSDANLQGAVRIQPLKTDTNFRNMEMLPDGTWTWTGTACQITSDQRLKQQIAKIDDKLLDAWEDVEPVQFKYNDAVDQKGKSARLHTGYVVQQIQKACESHGVDISAYGLFCHEEYPEETEEVEVENEDGTKTKERKVIREANEHYSLRYTEALIVECKYLRRCVERLEARLARLENPEESQEKGADK